MATPTRVRQLIGGVWRYVTADEDAGGGSQPVACVLARDAPFDIRDAGNYDVLWDALYDNLWDLDPLDAIPAGLGLTFAFDGSSSLIVPDEAGIWSFSYTADRVTDNGWAGSLVALGLHYPWVQPSFGGATIGAPYLTGSFVMPLSAGAQITNQVATETQAEAGTYTCTQVFLSIVRHA